MIKFLCFLLAFSLCAEEEIRVHLSTTTSLSPVYIGKFESNAADMAYAQYLEGILQFDLNYNGFAKVVSQSEQKELLLKEPFLIQKWKEAGVAHVIKGALTGNTLSFAVYSVQTGSVKHFKDIPLSRNLPKDRVQIHKVADGITQALFQQEGIANSRILFSLQSKNQEEWVSEIWECDWDGANARQITREGSYCVSPVFIPPTPKCASERFLYVSYKQGLPKIYIANLKEGIGRRIIELRGNQLLPAVAPKRDKIAYICDASGRTDLFIQDLNLDTGTLGKPIQLYSYPRSTQASPTFSPDGSKIAFVSDKDSGMRIYVISSLHHSKRAEPLLISKQNRENSCPSWSPDGTKIAYSAKTNGIRQIWIYDFKTGEEQQLTTGPGNKENPCWASDSLHLAFNSTDPTSSELYLVNLNQPEAIKITKGPGKKHYPTWGKR